MKDKKKQEHTLQNIANRLFYTLHMSRFPPIDLLELFLTHDCNFRCRYCFVGKKKKISMDFDTAKRAVDFIMSESRSPSLISIVYFGGEPLLKYSLIRKVTLYAEKKAKERSKEIMFGMTTNGALIDKSKIMFCARHKIRLLLSVDGDEATNDKNRKTADNKGTFRIVESKIPLIKRYQPWLGVRMTVCPSETVRLYDNFVFLLRKGINQFLIESNLSAKWARKELEEYKRQWQLIADLYTKKIAEKYPIRLTYFESDFAVTSKPNKDCWGCSGGRNAVTVAPSGEIYPCSHFLSSARKKSNDTWLLGNVKDGITDFDARRQLNCHTEKERPQCSVCRIKDFCTGGCPSENYDANKSIFNPHKLRCEFQKILVETVNNYPSVSKYAPKKILSKT
ncbi:MAG: SPASM domain-containing protein [Dehalococcoidales bacterium]|jgi:uncharacterized protein